MFKLNEERKKEPQSLALQMIKGLFTTLIIVIILWFSTIIGFVWYLNQYKYETTHTYEIMDVMQDTGEGGNNNNVINKGVNDNGETKNIDGN